MKAILGTLILVLATSSFAKAECGMSPEVEAKADAAVAGLTVSVYSPLIAKIGIQLTGEASVANEPGFMKKIEMKDTVGGILAVEIPYNAIVGVPHHTVDGQVDFCVAQVAPGTILQQVENAVYHDGFVVLAQPMQEGLQLYYPTTPLFNYPNVK